MATRMQQRRGTASQWTSADPILAAGEIGFESDTNQFKIGDGINHWEDLSYFKNLEDLGGSFDAFVELTDLGQPNKAASLDSSGYVPVTQLGNILGDAPAILDTLEEIASAIDDANGIVANKIGVAVQAEAALRTELVDNTVIAINQNIADARTDLGQDISDARADLGQNIADARTDLGQEILDAVQAHSDETTDVHGIADTAVLATNSSVGTAVSDHNSATTNVHGISDTSALATKAGTETLTNKTISAADNTVTINLSDVVDVTASVSELNILDGATVSTTELNYVDGVTSAIQAQLDAKAPLADPTFTGTTTTSNLSITGNLSVGGTTTTVNATDLAISDPLIYLASEQYTEDVLDVGFLAATGEVGGTEGSHKHSGLFRDVSDNKKWKLISNVQHPVSNVVDLTDAVYDTLKLGGVEFADGVQVKQGVPSLTVINPQTTAYTTVLTDRDKLVEVSSATGVTLTIPTNSSVAYPVGTSIDVLQTSTGQVTIAGADGVTVNATPGLKLRTQWSSATLFKRAENTWVVYGDLSA
jgi:hypothetical protein